MSGFRRLVLEISQGDPATMREAAMLARLMKAELRALFVEDADTHLQSLRDYDEQELDPAAAARSNVDPDPDVEAEPARTPGE